MEVCRPDFGPTRRADGRLLINIWKSVSAPDPTIWDGRFANNGWLQELPKPITKLTWDNAALISPRTAERIGVANHELVELSLQRTNC